MDIFNDKQAHENLESDLTLVGIVFKDVKTRLVEKSLESLIESIIEEMHMNLTHEAAAKVAVLSNKHPDSDIGDLIRFLVWKNNFKIMSAREFNETISEVGEDTDEVRVYADYYFIEVLKDGRHMLVIETSSWIEPGTTLEEMELELFNYVNVSNGPVGGF